MKGLPTNLNTMPPSSPNDRSRFVRNLLILSLLGNLLIVYVAYKALDYRDHVNYFRDKYLESIPTLSQRAYFAEENRALVSDTLMPNRVVFFGTQVTRWWKLAASFPEYDAINRGISGQRIAGYLLRFRPDVIELRPAAVVIELSSYNFRPENSVEEIKDYVASLSDLARANQIVPILSTVLPIDDDFEAEIDLPYNVMDSLRQFNDWLRSYCDSHSIAYVDAYQALVDSAGFLDTERANGQINLKKEGYAVLTQLTKEALTRSGVPPWGKK
jgi:lysophospholipase L1-like esterase